MSLVATDPRHESRSHGLPERHASGIGRASAKRKTVLPASNLPRTGADCQDEPFPKRSGYIRKGIPRGAPFSGSQTRLMETHYSE